MQLFGELTAILAVTFVFTEPWAPTGGLSRGRTDAVQAMQLLRLGFARSLRAWPCERPAAGDR